MLNLLIKTLCMVGGLLLNDLCQSDAVINISDYNYPSPNSEEGVYTVAIFGTNDIHGSAFPLEISHPIKNFTYKYGGLEYLAAYVKILREDWGERFLWLDGGDQFQGAIESKISNGSIITDFFNAMQVNGSAIGNHEWDFGKPFLYDRLESASWEYLAANIMNTKTNQTDFLPNTRDIKLLKVGEVKIGVIGLSTIETPFTTAGDLTDIKFLEYKDLVINYSKILKAAGANAIVLTTHLGMQCKNQYNSKMKLRIWEESIPQKNCEQEDEMSLLLDSLEEGAVDAVVAGHIHDVAHHWVKGVPVIQNINGGFFSQVLYLTFNATTKKVIKEKVQIEGPLPSCEKIFENTRMCNYIPKDEAAEAGDMKFFSFHNRTVKGDNSIDILFQKWWEEMKVYRVKIGYTEGKLASDNSKENTLGNLVSDALRNKTKADISIVNDGSLRTTWFPGDIRVEHLFNMYPFENYIVSFEMTGLEVKKMMANLQGGSKGFYHTSGLMQNVTSHPRRKLLSVKMFDGSEIENNKTYKITSNDFLVNGGDDFKDVRKWYTPRNLQQYSLLRDEMIDYVKMVAYIKENDFIDTLRPRLNVINPTNRQSYHLRINN